MEEPKKLNDKEGRLYPRVAVRILVNGKKGAREVLGCKGRQEASRWEAAVREERWQRMVEGRGTREVTFPGRVQRNRKGRR